MNVHNLNYKINKLIKFEKNEANGWFLLVIVLKLYDKFFYQFLWNQR